MFHVLQFMNFWMEREMLVQASQGNQYGYANILAQFTLWFMGEFFDNAIYFSIHGIEMFW